MIKVKTYDSGAQLVVEELNTPSASFGAMYRAGSSDEREDEEGVAHFLEHLMFKSTKSRTTEKISSDLEFLGSDINAWTCKTHTLFYFKAIRENFEESLKIYADMLQNGLLKEEDVNPEREVVIEEMNRSDDNPASILGQESEKSLYGGTSYSHRVLGSKEIIHSISIDKIRAFKDRFYTPNNMVFSVSGGITFDQAEKMIERYFPKYFEKSADPKRYEKNKLNSIIRDKFVVYDKDDKQVNFRIVINGVSTIDNQCQIQALFAIILGGGMSSRLFRILREEKSLAYSVYATDYPKIRDGQVILNIGTTKDKLKTAIVGMKEILYDMAKNGVTSEELEKAKNQKKAALIYQSEMTENVMVENAKDLLEQDKVLTIDERLEKINSITQKDIQKFAQRIFLEDEFVTVATGRGIKKEELQVFETCMNSLNKECDTITSSHSPKTLTNDDQK